MTSILNGPMPTLVLAAITKLYVVYGASVSNSRRVDSETNWNVSPDPTTLALMMYAVILPFWSTGKGGFQVRIADREEMLFAVKF